jgi:hypothetical protein
MQKFSFILGMTKGNLKLGEGLLSIISLTRGLDSYISITKQDIIDYLKDLNNLKFNHCKDYTNNFLVKKSNGAVYITEVEVRNVGVNPKTIIEKWGDYQIECNVYKYLYTRFWEVIVESVVDKAQLNDSTIEIKLKISSKTYSRFYEDLALQEDKAKKLIEDIYAFREYNLLTYYLNRRDIFLDNDSVIVPIMLRVRE